MKLAQLFGFLLIMLAALPALSQDNQAQREKLKRLEAEKEALRQSGVHAQLDSAILLTDAGEYIRADEKYRFVLANFKSLPSDLTFHFGKNSYLLGKYSQSVDWLNKYVQLKGTGGQYSAEAVDWLKKAESALLAERQEESVKASVILSKNYDIDCGPSGKVTCPVCNGSTVVIKKTYLGDTFKTCNYCSHRGFLTCDDYNKLLRGELKPNQ